MGYRANELKAGEVGDAPGERPIDFADFDEPSNAAAAAGPAEEKLETAAGSSTFFLLPPKSDPRNLSFSFFPFLSLSLSLSFLLKNPPLFSFSFSLDVADEAVETDD